MFELDWTPSDDLLVYAKYSRGNKAGGFNAGATFLFDAETLFEFDGEVLKSYEGGMKATLFNGRARLNASVFHYDYQGFQNFSAQGINLIVFNTDAENTGAEIELIANPFEGLELLLGLSLQDAKQKDVPCLPEPSPGICLCRMRLMLHSTAWAAMLGPCSEARWLPRSISTMWTGGP